MNLFALIVALFVITGDEIMDRSVNAGKWKDMKGEMVLILEKEGGEKKERAMEFFSQKYKGDLTRMLIRIKSPPSMAGMAFLYTEKEDEDERYLYIPSLRRIERIAASGKSGTFFSSEFTYYDVGKPKLKDWKYRLIEERETHYIVEALPSKEDVERDTGYSKIIYTVRKDNYLIEGAEYYDRLGEKKKRLKVKEWILLKDGTPFATDMVMENLKENKRSEIVFNGIETDTGIGNEIFSQRELMRR